MICVKLKYLKSGWGGGSDWNLNIVLFKRWMIKLN